MKRFLARIPSALFSVTEFVLIITSSIGQASTVNLDIQNQADYDAVLRGVRGAEYV